MLQLHQRFIVSAKKFSSRMAVIDKATNKDYTYGRMLIASLILKEHIGKIKGKYVGDHASHLDGLHACGHCLPNEWKDSGDDKLCHRRHRKRQICP
ncbi:MAG: hypothetical protein Q8M98_09085 [Candidatus Cloacimonadaceae bacterium]|nr:hypothetical protein [Candidatus Cloacimonadaceae bacterium]